MEVDGGGARPSRGAGGSVEGRGRGTTLGTDGPAGEADGERGRRSSSDDERRRGHGRQRARVWGEREIERELGEGEREGAQPFIERGEERDSRRGRTTGHQWHH
jgi:hypothetical protein